MTTHAAETSPLVRARVAGALYLIANIARPAEFLLDTSGTVRWRMVIENFFVIARPEQVLEAAKSLP